jgi:hypothetical protein
VLITLDAAATLPQANTNPTPEVANTAEYVNLVPDNTNSSDIDPTLETAPENGLVSVNGTEYTHRVYKTIKKHVVEIFCSQHNPVRRSKRLVIHLTDK